MGLFSIIMPVLFTNSCSGLSLHQPNKVSFYFSDEFSCKRNNVGCKNGGTCSDEKGTCSCTNFFTGYDCGKPISKYKPHHNYFIQSILYKLWVLTSLSIAAL